MKRNKKWLCVLLTVMILLVSSATIYGKEMNSSAEDSTLSPYFFVEGKNTSLDSFPLKDTKVSTNINGVIAETYVTQTYANEGKDPINASYVFPASTKVSVHGMKMEIGNEVITAQIEERKEAKKTFEQAKKDGKSASLLEQERPNVFTMNVSNIMPGDTVRIELHYTELITQTDGLYEFVFPTVVGPRYAGQAAKNESNQWVESAYLKDGKTPSGSYTITVNLSTAVPIRDLSCKSHQVEVHRNSESTAQVTLSNPEEFAGNRDFILRYKLTGQEVSSGLMLNKGAKENFFMLMVQPPEQVRTEDVPDREYIFVLDVSGSMYGYPLDTAKELITNLVSKLRETDSFNLILFSGAAQQMSPLSVPATKENIQAAINLINEEPGGGGTELAPALKRAINIPSKEGISRSIIVITDGYISAEKEIFELINNNLGITNFFSFGIGSSVNRYLVEGIAKAGMGESFVVIDSEEAASTAERFRTYIQYPVLTDIKVKYNGLQVYDVVPSNVPTLFAQKPILVYGKWRGEPTGSIEVSGKQGDQAYNQSFQFSDVTPSEENSSIQYLWARTSVERLTDYGLHNNPNDADATKIQVTAIGLKYSMITPYTSFIAVSETIRNEDKSSTDVKQALPLPSNVSNLAVGGSYKTGSEPRRIVPVLAMIMAGMLLRRKKKIA